MEQNEINAYLNQWIPARSPVLQRLEAEGRQEGIPNVLLSSIHFIKVVLQVLQPKMILEIGTAIGYSAIHMAEAAPQARMVTLEMDAERARRARSNFREAGVSERIELIVGDALTTLPSLTDRFDFAFIDAAKGNYLEFLQLALPLINTGGVIVSDNVLFRGWVVEDSESIDKKYRGMIGKLKQYNAFLANHPDLDTSFVPIGDGLAVSYKKR